MIAPLMTCSARLPVYALLIGAFIPQAHAVGPGFEQQGLVLFGSLCLQGIAWARWRWPGSSSASPAAGRQVRTLMMELPGLPLAGHRAQYRAWDSGNAW